MHRTTRAILVSTTTVLLLTGVVSVGFVLQRPFQRLTQPSVIRDAHIINGSQEDILVIVVRPDNNVLLPRVSVPADKQLTMRIFTGDSTAVYDRTEFLFVAWSNNRVTRSFVLSGIEIDALGGRVEFRKPDDADRKELPNTATTD
jgi:hypothetical protein